MLFRPLRNQQDTFEIGEKPTDDVIKQLTLEEKDELMTLIQDVQTLGE